MIDINIVLDLLSKRKEFIEETQILFALASQNKIQLFVSSLTFANAHYILANQMKVSRAQLILRKFKTLVEIVPFDERIIELSLGSKFKDYEDSIQYYSGIACSADIIITKNKKDFKLSEMPVLDVKEYLKLKNANL